MNFLCSCCGASRRKRKSKATDNNANGAPATSTTQIVPPPQETPQILNPPPVQHQSILPETTSKPTTDQPQPASTSLTEQTKLHFKPFSEEQQSIRSFSPLQQHSPIPIAINRQPSPSQTHTHSSSLQLDSPPLSRKRSTHSKAFSDLELEAPMRTISLSNNLNGVRSLNQPQNEHDDLYLSDKDDEDHTKSMSSDESLYR